MDVPKHINDLMRSFFGGGATAQHDFYEQADTNGVSAETLLDVAENAVVTDDNGAAILEQQEDYPVNEHTDLGEAGLKVLSVAGRPVPVIIGSQGHPLALEQLVRRYEVMPGSGTTVASYGPWMTLGDITHPTDSPESIGHCWQATSSVGSSGYAGLGSQTGVVQRGTENGNANGFHFCARTQWPDANYDNSSGCRIFIGLSNPSGAVLDSANAAVARVGFRRDAGNWKIEAHDGTTRTSIDTGVAFTPGGHYEFHLWCWMVDDDGPTEWIGWQIFSATGIASGKIESNLPPGNLRLAAGEALVSITSSVARRIRGSWTQITANV